MAERHENRVRTAFALVIFLLTTRTAGRSPQSFWDRLPRNAEVKQVPHFNGTLPSKLFSGYINLPGSAKQLFYILVLSQRNPDSDPLVFWTNGGPGCSSMGAFFEEHGPFTTSSKGLGASPSLLLESVLLSENPYSWSKVANVLYMDMPAGTGLSFSRNKSDYNTNDTQATRDTYEFLKRWFEAYPGFGGHDLYLSGESYAGIYIPLIASLIVDGNSGDNGAENINLKGYLIGNPTTNDDQYYRLAEFYQGISLISEDLRERIEDASCEAGGPEEKKHASVECRELQREVDDRTKSTFNFNVLVDCFYGMQSYNKLSYEEMKARLAAQGIEYKDPLYGGVVDSCDYDDRETGYLMNDEQAIHAAPFADSQGTLAGFFEMCQGRLKYKRQTKTTVPIHRANIEAGLSVFIYSGDHDRVVPTAGSEKWTRELGREFGSAKADFVPWWREVPKFFGWQIGGYLSIWDGLAFATIRGAGHQVPTHKPAQMLELLSHYLRGNLEALTIKPRSFGTLPQPPNEVREILL